MFSRRMLSIIWASALVLCSGAGYYWYHEIRPYETTENAYLKTHIIPLSPKISGNLVEVAMKDNQEVRKGEVLAVFDDREPRAKIAQLEARRLASLARLQTLKNRFVSNTSHDRQPPVKAARAEGRRVAGRDRAQNPGDDILSSIHSELGPTDNGATQVAEVEAIVKADDASLEMARIELESTVLRAPTDGVIGKLSVQSGQLARAGATLAFLIPRDMLWIEANFKEGQLQNIKPGQAVSVHVDALPTEILGGVVDSIAPASGSEFSILPPENASGNFTKIVRRVPVKIRFNPGTDLGGLKPGLSAFVKVRIK